MSNPAKHEAHELPLAHQAADALPPILAAIDNALRNGSYMTGANLAFEMLCDHLGVDRDALEFRPDWAGLAARAALSTPPDTEETTNG